MYAPARVDNYRARPAQRRNPRVSLAPGERVGNAGNG